MISILGNLIHVLAKDSFLRFLLVCCVPSYFVCFYPLKWITGLSDKEVSSLFAPVLLSVGLILLELLKRRDLTPR